MAEKPPGKTPPQNKTTQSKTPNDGPRKRELKSAKREDGVPVLKRKTKKSKKYWWAGAVLVIALLATIFLFPRIGTARYGICKTYIELHDPYPESLEYVEAFESSNLISIDFNRTDSFGQRTLNNMRCIFRTDGDTNLLAGVDLNGKANVYALENADQVSQFNLGVPSLLKNKPSLVMPKGLPDDIKDYK